MTGDPGPEKQPEALTPDDPNATKAAPSDVGGKSLLARIPGGRTLLTVVAAIVAVAAIAATTYALARNGGDETATPIDDESGAVTFGPNQPDTSATTSLPTLPTFPTAPSLPTDAFTFPTATLPTTSLTTPTFPGIPTSTYSYTPPAYTPPTYSYTPPTFPTTTAPTSPTTPTSTGPTKTTVTPVAPQAKPITRCGTYGSLSITRTTGVKYSLVVGDGKKGRWVVTAAARKGYVIADGATKRWSGNLGRYKECPLGLRKVAAGETGDGSGWAVKVRLWVPKDEDRPLTVAYSFANDVTFDSARGEGWDCGSAIVDGELSCSYAGDGTPPTLNVRVTGSAPAGTVALYAEDDQVDVGTFDAGD